MAFFKHLSNNFLWKTSVYIAVGGMTVVMIMRSTLKERVRQTEYYREGFKTLRAHEGAKFLLGEPIKETWLDISNPNFATRTAAYYEINVRGSKDKGTMYLWAKRDEVNDPWSVERIELAIRGDEEKRLLIKKDSEEKNNVTDDSIN